MPVKKHILRLYEQGRWLRRHTTTVNLDPRDNTRLAELLAERIDALPRALTDRSQYRLDVHRAGLFGGHGAVVRRVTYDPAGRVEVTTR